MKSCECFVFDCLVSFFGLVFLLKLINYTFCCDHFMDGWKKTRTCFVIDVKGNRHIRKCIELKQKMTYIYICRKFLPLCSEVAVSRSCTWVRKQFSLRVWTQLVIQTAGWEDEKLTSISVSELSVSYLRCHWIHQNWIFLYWVQLSMVDSGE